ncbi:MAG: hypothetical protein ACTSX0_14825 [Promethearchaeota archaeon]
MLSKKLYALLIITTFLLPMISFIFVAMMEERLMAHVFCESIGAC